MKFEILKMISIALIAFGMAVGLISVVYIFIETFK